MFFCDVKKCRNRVVTINLLQHFEKRCHMLLFSGIQKLLVALYKMSLNNIITPIATFRKRHLAMF